MWFLSIFFNIKNFFFNIFQPLQSDPIYEGCGSVKTCFGLPDNCVNDQSCRIITAVTVKGDRFEFEVQSGFGKYIYLFLIPPLSPPQSQSCVPLTLAYQFYRCFSYLNFDNCEVVGVANKRQAT